MATLKIDQLVFAEWRGDGWKDMTQEPFPIGAVGYVTFDRGPRYNLFVVVGYDETTMTVDAVFPRLRVLPSGELELGVDKAVEPEPYIEPCKCPHPCQGGSFHCACGAAEITDRLYADKFEPATDETVYTVHRFGFDWLYCYEHMCKDEVNLLHSPLRYERDGTTIMSPERQMRPKRKRAEKEKGKTKGQPKHRRCGEEEEAITKGI
jgi:hypothetical protein